MANKTNSILPFLPSYRVLYASLFLVWLLVQSAFFIKYGVRTSVDSQLYLADAMKDGAFGIFLILLFWPLFFSAEAIMG
jgi:hypothetical protein